MTSETSPTIEHYSAPPSCPICGQALLMRLSRGRKSGKAFVMFRCPSDGRHYRAFINDQEYVCQVVEKLEAKS